MVSESEAILNEALCQPSLQTEMIPRYILAIAEFEKYFRAF